MDIIETAEEEEVRLFLFQPIPEEVPKKFQNEFHVSKIENALAVLKTNPNYKGSPVGYVHSIEDVLNLNKEQISQQLM